MIVYKSGVFFLLLATLLSSVYCREFQFLNNLPGEVWIGCKASGKHELLNNGGWRVGAYQRLSVHSPDNWRGKFWARSWCNMKGDSFCETGDCNKKLQCWGETGKPPFTTAEVTLKGRGGLDYYRISIIDGFNLKLSITPLGGEKDDSKKSCQMSACPHEINTDCPPDLQVYGSGGVIGCKTACEAFDTDEYCCRGVYGKANACKTWNWPKDYAKFFKDRCPDAYSYTDNDSSLFSCKAPAYLITIG